MADTLTAKQLREERAGIAKQIKDFNDKIQAEKRDFTGEEQGQWERMNTGYNSLSTRITIAETAEKIFGEQAAPAEERATVPGREDYDPRKKKPGNDGAAAEDGITIETRSLALKGWCMRQYGLPITKRHVTAMQQCRIGLNSRHVDLLLRSDYARVRREYRALSAFNDTAGGYTVPEGFVNNLEMALLAYGGMREVAEVMRTSGGNDLPWPTANDTSNKGVLVQESQAVATNVDPTFGQVIFRAYKFSSGMVLVPTELLEDSAFDVGNWLGEALGTRIGRGQNDYFTTGTGNNQPYGIATQATVGVTAASATAIAADELISLQHSVDPAYRTGPSVGWMMHDNILMAIRKLKDGMGQYLWQPGLQQGAADRLLGFGITINQSMQSTIATGTKTVLFGMLNKYKIRDVGSVRLRRLIERYADADQQGFVAFFRADGATLDAGTHPIKCIQQA